MHVKVSVAVKTVGGISVFDGGKLEESEGNNYFFVVFYDRSALVRDLLSTNSPFVGQL